MTYRAHLAGLCLVVGCVAALAPTRVNAQATAISPYFMLVVDNSGSMTTPINDYGCSNSTRQNTCIARTGCQWNAAYGRCDASQCETVTTAAPCGAIPGCQWFGAPNNICLGDGYIGTDSCGQPSTRIDDARCVMQQVVNAYGDVEFGLMRYTTNCGMASCAAPATCTGSTCDGTAASGQMLVPIVSHSSQSVEQWADFQCTTGWDSTTGNPELVAYTNTPIAGTVRAARSYFEGTAAYATLAGDACAAHGSTATCTADTANNCAWNGRCRVRSPITASVADQTCRPISLVFLTDGQETCSTTADARTAVGELYASTAAGAGRHILSYFIGFGITAPDTDLESYATAGGTDAPGPNRAFYATDETSLALAFSQIIASSILVETCNHRDDDCDTAVDEGFTLYCDRYCTGTEASGLPGGCTLPAGHPTRDLCTPPAETRCDGVDDNCNGQIDEGLLNSCGTCGTAPLEACNNLDDDCDGIIDEGVCGGCMPSVEICDNRDNDCNGVIDMITRPCGIMVGACTMGTQLCTAGTWGTCSGRNPTPETCNGIDDDCDGSIDGEVQTCAGGSSVGTCRPGQQICTMGTLGPCVGAIGPTTEICDTLDNNCNGSTDEGNPGGGGACGSMIGSCTRGAYQCMAGALVCVGGSSGSAEICDGLDNDCDGSVDEGIASMGTCGTSAVGACNLGNRLCVGGSFMCVGAVGPTPELCDGLDNNCNGTVDEGNPEGGAMCGSNVGACRAGTTQCTGGVLVCMGSIGPMPEVCNAIDDDCNGVVDDGIPVGAPCGSSTGECTPGVNVCNPATGMLTCQGGISGIPEVCDTLDNDCDGAIDEDVGGGGACGSMVGTCMAGVNQCVGGAITCVGSVPPTTETCDCLDNDCNGTVDNPPTGGNLCPSGSTCVMCQCASACQHSEFGDNCPDGTTPFTQAGVCSCVAPACDATTCGGQTLMDTAGHVECAPTSADGTVGACICRNNGCTFACDGVTCGSGLACNPRSGACVENNCRGLGCPTGQLCNTTSGACEADPCTTAGCTATQACRAGTCEMPCASVTCTTGQTCHAGVCATDRCVGVTCPMGRVCNPTDASCVIDMCSGITCPTGQTCDHVAGGCHGDPCDTLHCPSGTMCTSGECVRSTTTMDAGPDHDAGTSSTVDMGTDSHVDSGSGTVDEHHRVLAGGGPLCSASASQRDAGGSWRAMLGLLVLAGVWSARRRRGGGR